MLPDEGHQASRYTGVTRFGRYGQKPRTLCSAKSAAPADS